MTLERAVTFALLAKLWQAGAGLATIPFIIYYLGQTQQGYYYTFFSLTALQSFFELGFSIVISVYASHEWHKLRRDSESRIAGDENALSRLTSLGRFVIVYSAVMSVAYILIIGPVGYFTLSSADNASFAWLHPWFLHGIFSAIQLGCIPFLSLLEGCGEMAPVAKFRLYQSVAANAVLWAGLAGGFELWAVAGFSFAAVISLIIFLGFRHGRFFSIFLVAPRSGRLSWKHDLLPMQWRLAVQGLFSYMSFPFYTWISYVYLGAVEAGRLGMTLQIIGGIQALALVFISARVPKSSLMAADLNLVGLRRLCLQATLQSLLAMLLFCSLLVLTLAVACAYGIPQTERVLSPLIFIIFFLGIICTSVVQGIALYLRAQKKELLTAVGVIVGCLYGLLGWQACLHFGAGGIALSYVAVTALVAIPLSTLVLRSQVQLREYMQ